MTPSSSSNWAAGWFADRAESPRSFSFRSFSRLIRVIRVKGSVSVPTSNRFSGRGRADCRETAAGLRLEFSFSPLFAPRHKSSSRHILLCSTATSSGRQFCGWWGNLEEGACFASGGLFTCQAMLSSVLAEPIQEEIKIKIGKENAW